MDLLSLTYSHPATAMRKYIAAVCQKDAQDTRTQCKPICQHQQPALLSMMQGLCS